MATRAEKFRAETERQRSEQRGRRHPVKRAIEEQRAEAQAARVALVEREDGKTITPRNVAVRASSIDGSYQLEATSSGRPSRKSTRMSPRVKADAGLRVRTMRAHTAPTARNGQRT
jgi:hypothetical protein